MTGVVRNQNFHIARQTMKHVSFLFDNIVCIVKKNEFSDDDLDQYLRD